ncbi:hypothetical protein ACFWPA_17665 [Rhodococcus sp. NPDC058505]|uniref:hypothetical protein n=1 Tax=unclassified Rhodococcus (in: high G+C Gram-positive bacteria) TaxID=192944 RepID=UPI003651D719
MNSNAVATITRLRALIDHPRTGPEERATAQRMLDRLLAKSAGTTGGARRSGAGHTRAGRHVRLDVIADLIRDDLAAARAGAPLPAAGPVLDVHDPVRAAPGTVSYAVTVTGDVSLDVTIDGVPRAWGWTDAGGVDAVTPQLQTLAERVADVVNGHNTGGADGGRRFFLRVRVPEHTLVW